MSYAFKSSSSLIFFLIPEIFGRQHTYSKVRLGSYLEFDYSTAS